MQLSAVRDLIIKSTTDAWHRIEDGPSYLGWHVDDGTARYEFHHDVAVYRDDVNLRMAWGLSINPTGPEYHAPWAKVFTDSRVMPVFADVLWRGALVDRVRLLDVDGGRARLPEPRTHRDGDGKTQQQVTPWETGIARLIHSFSSGEDYDTYLSQAGFSQA